MKSLLAVFIGSGAGGVLRYLLSRFPGFEIHEGKFPISTFIVNVTACLLLGLITTLAQSRDWLTPHMRLLLTTGFCGGFSTFSTLNQESIQLFKSGHTSLMLGYMLLSIVIGMASGLFGMYLGQVWTKG